MCVQSDTLRLLPQRQTLVHAKAVLLVDHHQAQAGEVDGFLEQGMSTDRDRRFATGQLRQTLLAHGRALTAGQPYDLDAQVLQPTGRVAIVLFGQQFGGSHQCRLIARLDGLQACRQCDHGLARTDIALHQP